MTGRLAPSRENPRRVTILGATGSIGRSTLALVAETPEHYRVEAVTAWRRATFLAAADAGACATYAGRIGLSPVGRMAGHVIKTQEDLDIAAALWTPVHGGA